MQNQQASQPQTNPKPNQLNPQPSYISTPIKQFQQTMNSQAVSYFNVHQYTQLQEIPFMNKRIEYQERQVIDKVPIEKTVIVQKQVKKIRKVPKQRIEIDYYPVQKQTYYVPTYVPETRIEYVPVEVRTDRLEYVPRSRSIVHMPASMNMSAYNNYQYNTTNYPKYEASQFNQHSTPIRQTQKQKQYQSTSHKVNYSRPSSARRHSLIATSTPINSLNHKNFDWKFNNQKQQGNVNQIIDKNRRELDYKYESGVHKNGTRLSYEGNVERKDRSFSFKTSGNDGLIVR